MNLSPVASSSNPPSNTPSPRASSSQRKALSIFAMLSAVALVWLSMPVASGLFLGTLLAFSLLQAYERLVRTSRRPVLCAVGLSVASGLLIVAGLSILLYFVVERGIVAASSISHGFEPEGPLRKAVERFEAASRESTFGPIDITGHIRDAAANAATQLTVWAAAVAGITFSALLMFFFTVMTSFFVLRHWADIVARAERLLPLHPFHTRLVLVEFQKVGKEVFIGTILTGFAQGLLAGLGYLICGAPEPALLGALTAIASLVPAIGTLLIWVPVGVILLVSGHVAAGIFELIWGALVVGIVSDYVIRPKLVGGKSHVPTLLTFISLFGGVELFGLLGLIGGPVIASVALALLRTYDREMGARAQPAPRRVIAAELPRDSIPPRNTVPPPSRP